MINRQQLLADLQRLLTRIESDLLERSESTEVPEVPAALHAEYEKAAKAERTSQNYEDWRTDMITQAAAAWVLSCVFVRFLEDNSLIDPPRISGPCSVLSLQSEQKTENRKLKTENRLERARDEHELYFRSHPKHTDREYLLSIFAELAKLPGTRDIFGEHNAINDLPNWLSGDAAGELLNFFQKIDASTGELVHDFTDSNWDTRFLGDLYQDLSEAARKKFALLQTPDFVEEFILDRTLDPAIDEFGLVTGHSSLVTGHSQTTNDKGQMTNDYFKMIDPACGSGHFLLGAFPRLLDRWQRKEPGTNVRELAQRTLNSIHGVDINPFAVAIARFRLLLVAMKACDIKRLSDAPSFQINVACGDSLLHGENRTSTGQKLWDYAEGAADEEMYSHAYPGEDLQTVRTLLKSGSYHCVVANPPYIVPRDRSLNEWYRRRFSACGGKYSLSVPFMQQIFGLAVPSGYTGQITADSFMKREFGKKLIESFFPTVDLTHVIDTKGAFIPGHATPTVILFGRQRPPVAGTLRVVMGIRGEPNTPAVPSRGIVWTAIKEQVDAPGSQSDYLSVIDATRTMFHKHPWSIGGGGASELKERLEGDNAFRLGEIANTAIGLVTLEDDAYAAEESDWLRRGIKREELAGFIEGDRVRDWEIHDAPTAIFPHDWKTRKPKLSELAKRALWPLKTTLSHRRWFRKTQIERGLEWYEYGMLSGPVISTPRSIVFGEIATHNHFVLDRGGKVFKQSAPVIKLPSDATDDDHYALLAYLNSSTACFWMKQVAHQKQMMGGEGVRIESKSKVPYAFSGTQLSKLPIPTSWKLDELRKRLVLLARTMDELVAKRTALSPLKLLERCLISKKVSEIRSLLESSDIETQSIRSQMTILQEEIDFTVYAMNGFVDADLLSKRLDWSDVQMGPGSRAFCIFRGINEDGFDVPESTPSEWPKELQEVWQRRLTAIAESPDLQLIEDSHYKRRWIGQQGKYNLKRNDAGREAAYKSLLLRRLESYFDFDGRLNSIHENGEVGSDTTVEKGTLLSIAQLSDIARKDIVFIKLGELFRNDPAFDVQSLVTELVLSESIPALPIQLYKPSGLVKRSVWERTWELQRLEDAILSRTKLSQADPAFLTEEPAECLKQSQVGNIPVPTKYVSKDFLTSNHWRLRGKLDVPKERWISFPHCEGPDGTLVICWAGYDHLQQAQAISAYYVRVQTEFGGSDDPRLIPLLASLIELLPWLKQWHNEPNANFDGLRMGDYFEGFVNEEARNLGKTLAEIKAWVPPKKVAKAKAAKRSPKKGKSVEVDE